MNKRQLGKTDLHVSEISLGCWTLGGPNWAQGRSIGWADIEENEAIDAIHRAIDLGVNHFDNADVYGNGKAERLLAKALKGRSEEILISTKMGHHAGTAEHAYEPQHIRHQCEQCLVNLQRDTIDLFYFHHADFGKDDRYLDGAIEVANELRKEGKIRALGLSAYSVDDFLRVVPKLKPDVLQGHANILHREFMDPENPVAKMAKDKGLSFVTFGPLSQGILLGKYSSKNPPKFGDGDHRKGAERFTAEYLAKIEPLLEKVKDRFGSDPLDLSRVALQYNLGHETVGCVIPGFRNIKQIESNLSGADKPLTPDDVQWISDLFKDVQ